MTSMGNLGFSIIEPRKGPNIYIIEKKGEMILTRDKEKIPDKIQVGAIIYGTYVVSEQEVLVTARMARASDFMILKSWSGKIPRVPFVENLLGNLLCPTVVSIFSPMLPSLLPPRVSSCPGLPV